MFEQKQEPTIFSRRVLAKLTPAYGVLNTNRWHVCATCIALFVGQTGRNGIAQFSGKKTSTREQ